MASFVAKRLSPGTPEFREYTEKARLESILWARGLLEAPGENWLILDTETTGLGQDDEIVQIGAIDGGGKVLMDNLFCAPSKRIPPEATAVHHITDDMVKGAPNFFERYKELAWIVEGRILVIYNKAYDTRMIAQSIARFSTTIPLTPQRWECAMLRYADFVGDWNEYYQNFRWPMLTGGDHSALGDCFATLEVIRKMAGG
ncbi:MAG: 3'-5' exonuclease [Anaerolineales bacterium]|nr:MAG: 3'-5' exonuclease [Anaerolineales bacterium]